MEAPTGHSHVSERETSPWICCCPTSGVMFARQAIDPSIPATLAQAHALRKAAGVAHPTGAQIAAGANPGMSNAALRRGLLALYHFTVLSFGGSFAGLWAALQPGTVAALTGKMSAFPAGHRLRRFDPAFTGYHKTWAARLSEADEVWFDNPLAPLGTYNGERVTKAELEAYVKAAEGAASELWVAAPIRGWGAEPVTVARMTELFVPPRGVSYPAGTRVFSETGELAPIAAAGHNFVDGRWEFEQSDNSAPNGSGFVRLSSGGSAGRYLIESQVTFDPLPPAPAPPGQAELDAAFNAGVDAAAETAKKAKKGATP